MNGAARSGSASVAEGMTAVSGGQLPLLIRLPQGASVFSARAERFRFLAQAGSPLAGYLGLMAELADAQHDCSKALPGTEPQTASGNIVPLDISSWSPGPAWRETLRALTERLSRGGSAIAEKLVRIRQASDERLEAWAHSLLTADFDQLDAALAPFVAAALQAHWTAEASRLDPMRPAPGHTGSHCPVCGFLPVAGVLQTGGAVQGLRYLVCGLCATEWNRPRIQCVHCGMSEQLAYFAIDGAGEAVKAEGCAACKAYVKLMNREKDSRLDPFADDLATLSLDLLMAEEGYLRLGFNTQLIPG